jgi:hypothetical protein
MRKRVGGGKKFRVTRCVSSAFKHVSDAFFETEFTLWNCIINLRAGELMLVLTYAKMAKQNHVTHWIIYPAESS